MLRLEIGRFVEALETITVDRGYYERAFEGLSRNGNGHISISSGELRKLYDAVKDIHCISLSMNLFNTAKSANRTMQFLSQHKSFDGDDWSLISNSDHCRNIFQHLMDMLSRVRDECQDQLYIQIPPESAALYQPAQPLFGEEVERVFPMAIDDIAEAGKCLAIGQGTAAVFHLMRVMEAGLKGLANELGVPYAPSWESYISQLEKILNSKNYSNLTDLQKAKRPFYHDALGDLSAIKLVWRNPTMHIVKSYDVNQAKMIFGAVGSFMKHLADKLEPIPSMVISTGPTP